jgi:hypothetical protein
VNKIAATLSIALALGITSPTFAAVQSGPSLDATYEDGTIVGRDPDANVRHQMQKDYPFLRN